MNIDDVMTYESEEGVAVITFQPDAASLNGALVDDITSSLLLMARNAQDRLLLDLKNVEFFNSTFVEVLVRCWKIVREKPDGQLAVCGLRPYCREILEVTNLDTVWPIYPDRSSALHELHAHSH